LVNVIPLGIEFTQGYIKLKGGETERGGGGEKERMGWGGV